LGVHVLASLLADKGTEYWQFCFGLPSDPADLEQNLDVYQSAHAHIMGRAAYEGMAGALPTATDHPFSGILNAARKVGFSRTRPGKNVVHVSAGHDTASGAFALAASVSVTEPILRPRLPHDHPSAGNC